MQLVNLSKDVLYSKFPLFTPQNKRVYIPLRIFSAIPPLLLRLKGTFSGGGAEDMRSKYSSGKDLTCPVAILKG